MTRVVVDPITRIEGHLRIEAERAEDGKITSAWSSGTMVRGIELILKAWFPGLDRSLGIFIPLIVTNCSIIGRAEAFASRNPLPRAVVDGLAIGVGFTLALLALGTVREVLGSGTLLGYPVMPADFEPWVVMILPPGGFFVLGTWLLLFAWMKQRRERRLLEQEGAGHAG